MVRESIHPFGLINYKPKNTLFCVVILEFYHTTITTTTGFRNRVV
jgi:hypothetical protein